jgi:hypothetical protein
LGFDEGDIIEKLSEPDDEGWCMGRKEFGSTGLFPVEYVKKFFIPSNIKSGDKIRRMSILYLNFFTTFKYSQVRAL